jgi:hypothetical protein
VACLNLNVGPLLPPDTPWRQGTSVTTPNGTVVTHTPGGGFPGVSVVKGASTKSFPKTASGNVWFANWGNPANFVAVLIIDNVMPGVTGTRSVVIVDTSGTTLTTEVPLMISATSAVSLPHINPSAMNGAVALLWGANDTGPLGTAAVQIIRSSNGDTLCSAVPFAPSGQVSGDVTATHLQIKNGGTVVASCPRPTGQSNVTPDPQNFPEAVIGPGVPPSMSSSTRQFTITNTGDDCLTVNAIGNSGPYAVTATSRALPATLDPGQSMTADVRFAPTTVGTYNVDLALTLSPAVGDLVLRCRGQARNAITSIGFSGSVGFGTVPLLSSATRTLTINNNGDLNVTITIPASVGGGDFTWPAAGGVVAPGASTSVVLTFAPTSEGPQTRTLTFNSTAPSSPHSVTLVGTGCVARALITIVSPTAPGIDFGSIERGFRMVRIVRVRNPGSGPLNFRATVTGSALFGIQRDGASVTAITSSELFTVDPVTACGPLAAGPGEVIFGVVFFANAAPSTVTGMLLIDDHNAPGAPVSFSFNLAAQIIAVVNVDLEVVLDRSGSMGGTSGSRNKSQTSIDAARLLVQLGRVGVDDRVGLVKFNNVPQVFSAITPVTTANQPVLVNAINGTELAPTGNTSIAGGVIEALRDLDASPRPVVPPGLRRAVVVLTDGHDNTPYTNPSDGIKYSLLGEDNATPLPAPTNTRIYAVGIGDSIDTGRLGQLAQATGGAFLHVLEFTGNDFFKLEKHFTQIYMDTVDLATIQDPVTTIVAGAQHVIPFEVLRGDVGCMVVVYDRDGIRIPFFLTTPAGETIDLTAVPSGFQIRPGITNTARFVEIKFPLNEVIRYAGTWKLIVTHDGRACFTKGRQDVLTHSHYTEFPAYVYDQNDFGFGFQPTTCKPWGEPIMYGFAIGVGSNFRMHPFVDPAVVRIGEPLQLIAEVRELGFPVTSCSVTVDSRAPDGATHSFTMGDDGLHEDGAASDGDYGHRFLQTYMEGTYEFVFRATGYSRDGEPVFREAVRSKYVEGREPLVPVDVSTTHDDECCRQNERWLRIGATLLFLILLALLLIWLK